jgi:hypothetical protein
MSSNDEDTIPVDAKEVPTIAVVQEAETEDDEKMARVFARGTKRDSDEAGLDEQGISKQLGSIEEDSVTTPPKKRQETGDGETADPSPQLLLKSDRRLETADPSPTNPPPKTPAKGTASVITTRHLWPANERGASILRTCAEARRISGAGSGRAGLCKVLKEIDVSDYGDCPGSSALWNVEQARAGGSILRTCAEARRKKWKMSDSAEY